MRRFRIRHWTALASLAVAGAVVLTACGNTSQRQSTQVKGGTLTVAIRESVENYDPAMYRSRISETVLANIFDELVVRIPSGKIVSDLATDWTPSDPTHWTLHLRKGVKFQDGSAFSADDVKFTLDRVTQANQVDGKTSTRQSLLPAMGPVTVVDPATVKLTLKAPAPTDIVLAGLSHIQVVPKALIEKEGEADFSKHPVGTGPFQFVSGTLDSETDLARFDGYWGGPRELGEPGPANLDKVIFKVIPELSTEIASLKSGDVQIVQGIPPDQLQNLKGDSTVQLKSYPGTRTTWFAMNTTKAPFDNVKVRQAMNYAIDSDSIIKSVLGGQAVRMTGPVPRFSAFFDGSLKPYPYDPAKAKQLLAAAGYPNGFSLVIDCVASFKDIADVAAQDLGKVGVNATVRVWDASALRTEALKGSRQMVLWDWGNSFRHPFDLLDPTLKTKGRGNYSLYSNPDVDSLLAKGATTIDSNEASADYKKAQDTIYEDAPWVFGWIPNENEAAAAGVEGWNPGPDGWEFLVHVSLKK